MAAEEPPRMLVAVRIRPVNEKEVADKTHRIVVRAVDEKMIIFDPADPSAGSKYGVPDHHTRRRDERYMFDYVFDDQVQQEEVYQATTKPLLNSVMEGYNAAVFAYGATGSGKTHTMIGHPHRQHQGIISLVMRDMFDEVQKLQDVDICEIFVSYLEVYNETIRDLLVDNSAPLQIQETQDGAISIPGLSLHRPETADNIRDLIEVGNKRRAMSPTEANVVSSRSHAVLQITVHRRSRAGGIRSRTKVGKLSLTDLAGSERASVTSNRGERLREGANINQSLLALSNCITALASRRKKSQYVPYRDSKLTRLLKDSLGGNCRTVMIATVGQSSLFYEDTLNTLKYASRAASIRMIAKRNVISVEKHVYEYKKIVSDLQAEIEELRGKLKQRAPASGDKKATEVDASSSLIWGHRVNDIAREHADVLSQLRQSHSQLRRTVDQYKWKGYLKAQADVCGDESGTTANKSALQAEIDCLFNSKTGLEGRIQSLQSRLHAVQKKCSELELELREQTAKSNAEGANSDDTSDWYRHACMQKLRAEILQTEKDDLEQRLQEEHLLVDDTARACTNAEKLVRRQYAVLQKNGLVSTALHQDCNRVVGPWVVELENDVELIEQAQSPTRDRGGGIRAHAYSPSTRGNGAGRSMRTPRRTPRKARSTPGRSAQKAIRTGPAEADKSPLQTNVVLSEDVVSSVVMGPPQPLQFAEINDASGSASATENSTSAASLVPARHENRRKHRSPAASRLRTTAVQSTHTQVPQKMGTSSPSLTSDDSQTLKASSKQAMMVATAARTRNSQRTALSARGRSPSGNVNISGAQAAAVGNDAENREASGPSYSVPKILSPMDTAVPSQRLGKERVTEAYSPNTSGIRSASSVLHEVQSKTSSPSAAAGLATTIPATGTYEEKMQSVKAFLAKSMNKKEGTSTTTRTTRSGRVYAGTDAN